MTRGCLAVFLSVLLTQPVMAGGESFIYGKVLTRDDETITGFIRWGDEEVLWTDHLNGRKRQNLGVPLLDQADKDYLAQRKPERLVSWREVMSMLRSNNDYVNFAKPHDFIAQFGDVERIDVREGYAVAIKLRNGETVEVLGGSNDIGTDVFVWSGLDDPERIDWSDLSSVTFEQSPGDAVPPFDGALFGRVDTEIGQFVGQVQWDHDERVGIDELDGDVDGQDRSIPFSKLESISKRGDGSLVRLKDGSSFHMTGTNDVDSDNRGIIVTVPGTGRVDIRWRLFNKVTFSDPSQLASYSDFGEIRNIAGQVQTREGERLTGRLIFNLDRAFNAEMLFGESAGLKYTIPFRDIKRISPKGTSAAQVALRTGDGLTLAYSNAVTDKNDGLIVFGAEDKPEFVSWERLEYLELSN